MNNKTIWIYRDEYYPFYFPHELDEKGMVKDNICDDLFEGENYLIEEEERREISEELFNKIKNVMTELVEIQKVLDDIYYKKK